MTATGKGKASRILVWILLALLIVGLAGFGIGGFGGSVRSVGSVGDAEIDVNDYARALQQELQAISAQTGRAVSLAEAQQLGIDRGVFQRLLSEAALDHETARIGLSVGDEQVRAQILAIPAFRGLDGAFDRETYNDALSRSGLTVAGFEEDIRAETSRTLLQGALAGAIPTPTAYAEALVAFVAEERDFTWTRLDQDDLAEPLPEPTDTELQDYYTANAADFTLPETKRITFAWLRPEMLLDTIDIEETALREIYEQRIDEFVRPERRLVERLAFPDEAAATDAKAQIDSGEVSFDDLVAERELSLDDIALDDVTEDELGAAGAEVFALTSPGVVGPLESDLGPALFRMNGILAAQNQTYEDVEVQLRAEFAGDRARRDIADRIDAIDDLLAGGATVEELADETEMEVGQIDWYPILGDGIAAYNSFRDAAAALTVDDFPEVRELEDGGIYAMRLDEVVPPTLQPFDQVRDDVIAGWETTLTEERLLEQANALAGRLSEGVQFSALELPLTPELGITRDGFVQGAPPDLIETVFEMTPGETRVVEGFGSVHIVQLDRVHEADTTDPDTATLLEAIEAQARQGIAQDALEYFARAIEAEAGISINQAAINAVHSQFP